MRLLVASDVHTEFHADGGRSFVDDLDPRGIDVLVLAGDIAVGAHIPAALGLFCERFRDAVVVYLHGNHEFYGSSRPEVLELTRRAAERLDNLRWLDVSEATIRGVRFVGAPLWFPDAPAAAPFKRGMNDFHQIADLEVWVYEENRRARELLDTVLPGDVVVTHHLPSQRSVAPQYRDNPLNPFFVCDVESTILARRPSVWIHGHTHSSLDYVLGETRVVCNPFGYVRYEENREFSFKCTLEVTEPR